MWWRALIVTALLLAAGPAASPESPAPAVQLLGAPPEGVRGLVARAIGDVRAVWGGVPARIVIEAPANDTAAAARAGRDVSGLAAVATADRIVLVPSGFARLTEQGRRVVLTHELTHLATGDAARPGMPEWLVEGFADYVAYRGSGIPMRTAAPALAKGPLPERLPDRVRLARDYEAAWTACRFIAESRGESRLVALYRAAAKGRPDTGGRGFVAGWRKYLREEFGR